MKRKWGTRCVSNSETKDYMRIRNTSKSDKKWKEQTVKCEIFFENKNEKERQSLDIAKDINEDCL